VRREDGLLGLDMGDRDGRVLEQSPSDRRKVQPVPIDGGHVFVLRATLLDLWVVATHPIGHRLSSDGVKPRVHNAREIAVMPDTEQFTCLRIGNTPHVGPLEEFERNSEAVMERDVCRCERRTNHHAARSVSTLVRARQVPLSPRAISRAHA
jgi:hypothetical protein